MPEVCLSAAFEGLLAPRPVEAMETSRSARLRCRATEWRRYGRQKRARERMGEGEDKVFRN